jgi:hypothetical protein
LSGHPHLRNGPVARTEKAPDIAVGNLAHSWGDLVRNQHLADKKAPDVALPQGECYRPKVIASSRMLLATLPRT